MSFTSKQVSNKSLLVPGANACKKGSERGESKLVHSNSEIATPALLNHEDTAQGTRSPH